MKHRTTFETQIDALYGESVFHADEFEVPVELELTIEPSCGEFEITSITRLDNGNVIEPTTDILQDLNENVSENLSDIIAGVEGDYADHCYELARDAREHEL